MMKEILKLMRVKHYIKNLLIFIPIIFSKNIFNIDKLLDTIGVFILFSLVCSVIYIINDIYDVEKDRKHPVKKNRPIASGEISIKQAIIIAIILVIIILTLGIALNININTCLLILTYFVMNILYSYKLKDIPIIDVAIIAISLWLRAFVGATAIDVEVSGWLYLTMLSIAFYLGFGKRRNEITNIKVEGTRNVIKSYNVEFLDKNMYMCLTLGIVFYSLWCLEKYMTMKYILLTVPLAIIVSMRYSMIIEDNSLGDPTDVILKDRILQIGICIFAVVLILMLYI